MFAPCLKLRPGRAGAKSGHGDAGAAELFGDRFREGEYVGFGRVIDRHEGAGLEGGGRGDVQYLAAASRDHGRKQSMSQLGDCLDVQAEHGKLHVEIGLVKGPEISESGIIDEGSDLEPALLELPSCCLRGVSGRKILHNDLDANAVFVLKRFSQVFRACPGSVREARGRAHSRPRCERVLFRCLSMLW